MNIDNQRNGLETQVKPLMLHADATSVIRPHTLYFGTCISTLNIFQDFLLTNFKQEQQCLCNY